MASSSIAAGGKNASRHPKRRGRKPTPWITPAQTAQIISRLCQAASELVVEAKRAGIQKTQPASASAMISDNSRNGPLSVRR